MERSLLWSAFALGWVGWLCTVLLTFTQQLVDVVRPEAEPEAHPSGGSPPQRLHVPLPHLCVAVAVALGVFLLTLPTRPPFSPGQGWGRGFLLGCIGAALATATVLRLHALTRDADQHTLGVATVAGPGFLAVGVTTMPLLWRPLTGILIDPLIGIACGWFVTSLILYLGLVSDPDTDNVEAGWALVSGLGFEVTLCAVTALGVYRNALSIGLRNGTWSVIAVTFAAGVPLAMLISALCGQFLRRVLARTARPASLAIGCEILLSVLLLISLGSLLAVKVTNQPPVALVVVLGLLLGLVAWWLVCGTTAEANNAGHFNSTSLASLVVLCATMVAYQLLQGFGVGLMLLAAWSVVGLALPTVAPPRASVPALLRLLCFGVALLLYRLFAMRFKGDLHSATLTDNYALFGFLLGAVLPALLVQTINPRAGHVSRLFLAGALALAIPGTVVVLWGAKCCLALLAGLAVAIVMDQRAAVERGALTPTLAAVGVALLLVQWTHRVLPIAELSRTARVHALTCIIVIFLVVLLVVDYGGRLAEWLRRRRQVRLVTVE